jgi:hypothetical protein
VSLDPTRFEAGSAGANMAGTDMVGTIDGLSPGCVAGTISERTAPPRTSVLRE